MINSKHALALLPFAAAVVQGRELSDIQSLAYLNADPDSITVSGHSAGGHYSQHLLIVMSDTIKGAGISKGAAFTAAFKDFKDPVGMPAEYFRDQAIAAIDDL